MTKDQHAVVIVTYNREELLRECLAAIEAQQRPYDCIVVVDNASTDGTELFLSEKKKDPRYLILREDSNLGGAGGFAHGIRAAYETGADWLTIIDDDAMLRPDFLRVICGAIRSAGGRRHCFAGVPLTDGIRRGHRRTVRGRLIRREHPVPFSAYEKRAFACDIASFCGLVVHREVIDRVGFPNEAFFIWYDDTEYCLRISERERIVNINAAVIDHRVPPAKPQKGFVGWKDYYGIRNRLYTARIHYGMPTALWIAAKKTLRCLWDCARLVRAGEAGGVRGELRLYRDGIRDGLRGQLGVNPRYYPG